MSLPVDLIRTVEQSLTCELVWGVTNHGSDRTEWPWRCENVLRVWQLLAGVVHIELADGRKFRRDPGEGYVIPPWTRFLHTGTPHRLRGAKLRFSVLGTLDVCALYDLPLTLTSQEITPFVALTDQMCAAVVPEGPLDLARLMRRQALGFQLFDRLVSLGRPLLHAQERLLAAGRMLPAIQYMKEHLRRSISRAELAATVHLSEGRFAELFRAIYGETAMSYLMRLRMSRAQELLIHGSLSLNEIATLLGFTDAAHFSNAFKARCGVTPSQYRGTLTNQN